MLGDQYIYYINNRVNYHEALTYSKLRDEALAKFDKKGDGYGECLAYQGAVVQCLMNNEKELKSWTRKKPFLAAFSPAGS